MIKDNKTVRNVFTLGDKTFEEKSGGHFTQIHAVAVKWLTENKDAIKAEYDKFFGPGTPFAKAQDKLVEISKIPPEEQTDEHRKVAADFQELAKQVEESCHRQCPQIKSYVENKDGEEVEIMGADILSFIRGLEARMPARKEIGNLLGQAILDLMHRTDVKIASISLVFDRDNLQPGESANAALLYVNPFYDVDAADLRALGSRLLLTNDSTIPGMAAKLGIPWQESKGPDLIIPAGFNPATNA